VLLNLKIQKKQIKFTLAVKMFYSLRSFRQIKSINANYLFLRCSPINDDFYRFFCLNNCFASVFPLACIGLFVASSSSTEKEEALQTSALGTTTFIENAAVIDLNEYYLKPAQEYFALNFASLRFCGRQKNFSWH
jgi:hypothetical protein